MHIPVLQKEILEFFNPQPGENFIDCTMGEGGHTLAILEKVSPGGNVLAIDCEERMLKRIKNVVKGSEFQKNLILVRDNFVNLKKIVEEEKFFPIHGILFDLGLSSWHLGESGRGFSFLKDEPLDMRFDPLSKTATARDIINEWQATEIERILSDYGEEDFAPKIAQNIIEARRGKTIKSTSQLVEIIKKSVPIWYQHKKIHPATKTFQALRITVNKELYNLQEVLPQAHEILAPGGKLAVISFQSLEDRIVKNFFREESQKGSLEPITKKPIISVKGEISINPRARSAKLRVAQKIH